MSTKLELLAELKAAGVEGYSMDDLKDDLEDAVALLEPEVVVAETSSHEPPEGWTGHPHRFACWCGQIH